MLAIFYNNELKNLQGLHLLIIPGYLTRIYAFEFIPVFKTFPQYRLVYPTTFVLTGGVRNLRQGVCADNICIHTLFSLHVVHSPIRDIRNLWTSSFELF